MNVRVLRVNLSQTSCDLVVRRIMEWAREVSSRYVCVANVHVVMEGYDLPAFNSVVNDADLIVPDGMPLVWMLRLKGHPHQQRVYGPDLMLRLMEDAVGAGVPVGFYGGRATVLESLKARMLSRFEGLKVEYTCSPPFRELDQDEDDEIVRQINQSGARVLFVGLGCPKQEMWMAAHRGRVKAVMIGVGAAFDFHAGFKPQAPAWIQRMGLEWLFRLATEPRRLWKRYLYHNPRFLFLALADLLGLIRD